MILCNDDIFPLESSFSLYIRKIKDLKIVLSVGKVVTFYLKVLSKLMSQTRKNSQALIPGLTGETPPSPLFPVFSVPCFFGSHSSDVCGCADTVGI